MKSEKTIYKSAVPPYAGRALGFELIGCQDIAQHISPSVRQAPRPDRDWTEIFGPVRNPTF